MNMDIVALGELLIDFAGVSVDAEGYPTLAAHPGGAPANFLASATVCGEKTAMLGKVGNDAFGRLLKGTLDRHGINTEGIIIDDSVFTTLAFVTVDAGGDRSFSFARKPGADTCITADEVRCDIIDSARVFHFGTLSLTSEPARQASYAAIDYAKKAGKLISCDPNLREPLWSDLNEAREQMLNALGCADIIKISDYEVEFLWGLKPEEGMKRILDEFDASLVYVTCGAEGCLCSNGRYTVKAEGLKGLKVADTTGAGDIFGGAAMARFLQKGKAASELSEEELLDIARFGCAAAGLSTRKAGGISSVPSLEEIESAM